MSGLRLWVFGVEYGLSVFMRAPNGRTLLYDCGLKRHFLPSDYLSRFELAPGERLDQLIVSHPHADHLFDLREVIARLQPRSLRRQVYDWLAVEAEGVPYKYQTSINAPLADAFQAYVSWQAGFDAEPPAIDWGEVHVQTFGLTPDEAKALGPRWINNSSLVLIVSCGSFKIVVPGDLLAEGWRALLEREPFRAALRGTSVFVTSYHGRSPGYTPEIYEAMGKPAFNLTTVHLKGPSLSLEYSKPEHAVGYDAGLGKTRNVFTNWNQGSLLVRTDEAGGWRALFHHLLPTERVESTTFVRGQDKLPQ